MFVLSDPCKRLSMIKHNPHIIFTNCCFRIVEHQQNASFTDSPGDKKRKKPTVRDVFNQDDENSEAPKKRKLGNSTLSFLFYVKESDLSLVWFVIQQKNFSFVCSSSRLRGRRASGDGGQHHDRASNTKASDGRREEEVHQEAHRRNSDR